MGLFGIKSFNFVLVDVFVSRISSKYDELEGGGKVSTTFTLTVKGFNKVDYYLVSDLGQVVSRHL